MAVDYEVHEALRSECERLQHKLAYHESDIARTEALKEKVTALVWENDSLKEKAQAYRQNLDRYRGLAMAVQQGLLVWTKTPETERFRRSEAAKLRLLESMVEPQVTADRPVEYQGLTPVLVPK